MSRPQDRRYFKKKLLSKKAKHFWKKWKELIKCKTKG